MTKQFLNVSDVIAKNRPVESFYCISLEDLTENVQGFLDNFCGCVAWAVKSNPHPLIVRTIYEAGIRDYDVASACEIEQISLACNGSRLHFNHPVKSPEAITLAYDKFNVRNYILDHSSELEKLTIEIPDLKQTTLLVRFYDPSVIPSSNYDFGKKFGAPPEVARNLLITAAKTGFHVGLAFHPGTQYRDPDIYRHMVEAAEEITKSARDKVPDLQIVRLNIGGGFPAYYPGENLPPLANYFEGINKALGEARERTFGEDCEYICEPGRAIVANTSSLVARVELKKDDGRIYINDGFYGGLMEQKFVDFSPPVRAYSSKGELLNNADGKCQDYMILGPTCDSLDILHKPYQLPKSIRTGDYIEFGFMGAYSNASATSFNGCKPASFIAIKKIMPWPSCQL